MLKEVIVVEGKQDIVAVKKALDADCIATHGFNLAPETLNLIDKAYKKRGIVILTDPDSAGERIRRFLTKRFPEAKHAYVPRAKATAHGDIGIEQASIEAITDALAKLQCSQMEVKVEFTLQDLIEAGLTGRPDSAERRGILGEVLGIGYANAKTFVQRLNHYSVSREAFHQALTQLVKEEDA